MIVLKDEESANITLSLENLIDAIINELEMWVALKNDDPNKAWFFLISAQYSIRAAIQSHTISLDLNANGYTNKLYYLEKLLFPPQIFFSPSIVAEGSMCSICNDEYGGCEHVVGKAYMGKICHRITTKIKEIKEISIVEEPANKRARMLLFSDNGITRDFMTWRVIETNE